MPTQVSVLAHVSTQVHALDDGAPLDLLFQSVAGTAAANRAFGIDLRLLDDADAAIRERGRLDGSARWYFETGQGSELSRHAGLDQGRAERVLQASPPLSPATRTTRSSLQRPELSLGARQVSRRSRGSLPGEALGVTMGVEAATRTTWRQISTTSKPAVRSRPPGCNNHGRAEGATACYRTTVFHARRRLREMLDRRPAPEFELVEAPVLPTAG